MRAILLADLYGSRKNLYIYIPLTLAFMALAVSAAATVTSLTFALCASVGAGMLPVVSMGSAEASHWDRYAQMLPGGKAQAVNARFLEALAVAGALWVYSTALFCAKAALGGWTWAEARFMSAFVPAVGLLSSALCLGAVCRLGWARGSVFFCITVGFVAGSRSLIPDRLGGADYDGDTVHLYAEPMLCRSILRNYNGGLENESNLPLLKIPSAEALIADANNWGARFQTVKSTFSSRIGLISNAALRRSILAYDEAAPEELRERCRKETETLTILTGLEIDSAKSGIKPDLSEYLSHQARVRSIFLRYKEIAGEPDDHKWYDPTKNQKLRTFFNGVDWEAVTANLERTPFYAREMGRRTKPPKAAPADSSELFTFAQDARWKEKLDAHTLERMGSIIADYEEAKRRCEAYRHAAPSGNYRKDIQRILFSQDRENEVSVDALYDAFSYMSAYDVHATLTSLRQSDWQFTPKEDRLLMLYTLFPGRLPSCRDILCDFRCGGYRMLGDVLMDLDEQHRDVEVKRHKGVRQTDTEQMKRMMRGAADSQDYRQRLIRTEFPEYKAEDKGSTAYMGSFTFPMLMDFKGFRHILTILARGYLFREDGR